MSNTDHDSSNINTTSSNSTDNPIPLMTNSSQEEEEQQLENEKKLKGIDIEAAMSILSSRQLHSHDHSHEHGGGGCSAGKDDDIRRTMGQTINLLSDYDDEDDANKEGKQDDGKTPAKSNHDEQKDEGETKQQEKAQREKEIRSKFESMSLYHLLKTIFEIQKERVEAYHTYDNGLSTVLSSGNVTSYPVICANATATFSVLSNTIRTIKSVLESKYSKRKDLIKLVAKLQLKESDKLNLTAALHLEKMRERDHTVAMEMKSMQKDNENDDDDEQNKKKGGGSGGEESIGELLRQGVSSLNIKLSKCIEDINEILEELRYELAEEEDEE